MTDKRKALISQASMDIDSGNYLLYPRSKQQIGILKQMFRILHEVHYGKKLSVKQKRMYHEYMMNADYDYYNKHKSDIKN